MRTWQSPAWQSRPSLGRADPKPFGAPPLVLAIVLAVALAIHGFHRANIRLPAQIHWVHWDIVGKARVIDGDTIDIAGSRIRLQGIDAPEADQTCTDAGNRAWPCGRAATRVLIELIAGRPLKCESSGFDRYRRVLAVCALPDGSDVNAWMVQQGWALAYYSDVYRPQEAEAQAAKRGIWAGRFMPPWEWRHRHLH
jgi:endonuclease YncB( thermonuclease family)